MRALIEKLFRTADPAADWTINRLRAIQDNPIGPRYPTGMFTIFDPTNETVSEEAQ